MLMRALPVFAAALLLVGCGRAEAPPTADNTTSADENCALPPGIQALLDGDGGWRVVTSEALGKDDQTLWKTYHPGLCPGVAELALPGTTRPAFAVTQIATKEDGGRQQRLVAFVPTGSGYLRKVLSPPGHAAGASVIWRAPPGEYVESQSERVIRSPGDSLIYEQMEAGAFQYFFIDGDFEEVLVSE